MGFSQGNSSHVVTRSFIKIVYDNSSFHFVPGLNYKGSKELEVAMVMFIYVCVSFCFFPVSCQKH